jgi:hypothetical protein
MREWVKKHPKILATIGVAATAAGAYYGVPPSMSEPFLKGLCAGLGLC